MPRILTSEQIASLGREDLYRFQNEKFKWYVRTILAPHSPFYARLLREHGVSPDNLDGIDAWERLRLPLVRKSHFRADVEGFVLRPNGSRAEAVKSYQAFVEAVGALPPVAPIRSYSDLLVEQTIPKVFSTRSPLPDDQTYTSLFEPSGTFFSGGSSGAPISTKHTRLDRELFELSTKRLHATLVDGLHEQNVRVVATNLYPQAPHMGFWMASWGLGAVSHAFLGMSAAGTMPTERLAELSLLNGVNVFAGIPSYFRNRFLPALVEAARSGVAPMPKHMAVVLGGEVVGARCRNDVRELLTSAGAESVHVVGGYGATESRFNLWYECDEGHGYHSASPDLAATRIVKMDSDGRWAFARDGEEGLVAHFPLDGTGTVLCGFLLGDAGVMSHEPCPRCGFRGPRLVKVSRVTDFQAQVVAMGTIEQKIRGTTVNLEHLREEIAALPDVAEVQLVLRHRVADDSASPDELVVRLATPLAAGEHKGFAARIADAAKQASEVTPVVEIVSMTELLGSELKFRPIIDLRRQTEHVEPEAPPPRQAPLSA